MAREKVYSEDDQRAAQKGFYDHLKSYLSDERDHEIAKLVNNELESNSNLKIVFIESRIY